MPVSRADAFGGCAPWRGALPWALSRLTLFGVGFKLSLKLKLNRVGRVQCRFEPCPGYTWNPVAQQEEAATAQLKLKLCSKLSICRRSRINRAHKPTPRYQFESGSPLRGVRRWSNGMTWGHQIKLRA